MSFPLTLLKDRTATGRVCGPCTACCTTLRIDEPSLQKPERARCPHVCAAGCSIYEERPAPCRSFKCLWLDGGLVGDERRRPDNLGLMLHWSVSQFVGMFVMAWELWPGASEEPQAKFLIHQLQKRALVLTLLMDRGDQPGTRRFTGPAHLMAAVERFRESHPDMRPV